MFNIMHAPFFSTAVLAMEFLIGVIIFFVVYEGYKKNNFPERIALFAIGYEIIFNVGYMIWRVISKPSAYAFTPALKITAAFHGILSLAMLIAVIVFFALARRDYREGINYFRAHRAATFLFLFFWLVSLLSGIYLYFKIYS